MIEIECKISELTPTQSTMRCVKEPKHLTYFLDNPSEIEDIPITIVKCGNSYLMADGHHRACAAYLLGREYVPIEILEDDNDVEDVIGRDKGVFGEDIHSLGDFIINYERVWRHGFPGDEEPSIKYLVKKHKLENILKEWEQKQR